MHCKGAPANSPVSDSSEQARGTDDAASFPRPAVHGKPAVSTGEQHFSAVMAHTGLEKPAPRPPSSPPPTPHTETAPSSMQLSPAPTPTPLPELRTLVPHHLLSSNHQEPSTALTVADHIKLAKPQLSIESVYGPYVENGNMSVEVSRGVVGRSFLPPTDNNCSSLTSSSRPSSGSYRPAEGPVISSVTLWGLAMKTLQSDNDTEP